MPPAFWLLLGVVLPLALAVFLVRICGAQTEDDGACHNPQKGPFNRCHLHEGDGSSRDWMFVALVLLAALWAVLMLWLNWGLSLEGWLQR